jgi:predicted unusual protein kinase regulating ubiquinone biosynthesis (AarF/ABC1/UbiB family)
MLPYLRGARRAELQTHDGRTQLARSLRLALEDGGVTFIELGQILATRRDLLPAEFIDELSGLQDDAAQVHTAMLDSGERVVVKVRRPGIDTVVAWDLDIVDRLARRLQRSTRWGRGVGAVDLSNGFAAALRKELDLRIEAQNMTAVAAAASRRGGAASVRIPRPHEPLCTSNVLVMERLGITPDVRMFADLFRIIAEHELSVPPEIAGAFRALATIEGTLTQLAPGFDILTDARRFTTDPLAAQLSPAALRKTATDELISLVPTLRRLPRRLDRISGSLEQGRLSINVRLLADESDRRYLTGLVHQLVVAFLAATLGVMSVLMLGLRGGPSVTNSVTLYAFFGYCLLVFAGVLALRVLVLVFRSDTG